MFKSCEKANFSDPKQPSTVAGRAPKGAGRRLKVSSPPTGQTFREGKMFVDTAFFSPACKEAACRMRSRSGEQLPL